MFSCTTAQHIYCTNCTVYSRTVLTAITHNLPLHAPVHNSTQSLQLMPSAVQSSPLFHITPVSVRIHSVISLVRPLKLTLLPKITMSPVHSTTKHTQQFLRLELWTHQHISRLGTWNSYNRLKMWCDSDKEQTAVTEIIITVSKLEI
jgi:hypothetical protein